MTQLTRADIVTALGALAWELLGGRPREEIVVVGGAALVLHYGARAATRNVDVVVLGQAGAARVREAGARVAASLGLPDDWINDAAKGFVHGLALGETILDSPSLLVHSAAPRQLLAMKSCAWRDDVDIEDARLLVPRLPGGRQEIWSVIEPLLGPGRELTARYAFEDLWEAEHGPS